MSLSDIFEAQSHLTLLFFTFLLCCGYFSNFLVVQPISIFFQISSLTGQVLVNKFLTICNFALHVIKLIYLFLQVLYEDALIFLKDAVDKIRFAIFLLQQFYLFLENLLWNLISGFLLLSEAISSVFGIFYYALLTFKGGIQLLGLTIWHFFAALPGKVICNLNAFIEFLSNTIKEFQNSIFELHNTVIRRLENMYYLLFDIPLDSVYGLIIAAVLSTLFCIKIKDICSFITSAFLKLCRQFISFGGNLWSGRFLELRSRRNMDYSFEDDERLCIVCQYNLKEIIIFPCKHLCLCGDCSSQLTKNQPLCPICRSDITGILKVYL